MIEAEAKGNETCGFFPLSNPHSSLTTPVAIQAHEQGRKRL